MENQWGIMDDLTKLSRLKRDDTPGLYWGWSGPLFSEVRGNSLVYRPIPTREMRTPDTETMDRLLQEFVTLAVAPNEAILRFANRWGVLGLCKHGLPATHSMTLSKQVSLLPIYQYCTPKKRQGYCYEPLERWRYYARQAKAITSLAYMPSILEPEEVFNGNPETVFGINIMRGGRVEIHGLHGDEEDWKALFGDMWFTYLKHDRVVAARDLLTLAIERLFKLTHIRPVFTWKSRKPDFHFCGRSDEYGLFESLVMQLMLHVARARGLSVCRECLQAFLINHSHRSTSYCPQCNKKVQHRQAVQRFSQKEKENPNREKRKKLSASERQLIARRIAEAREQGMTISKLIVELASEYKVTTSAIYKIAGKGLEYRSQ